jgi:hypothetical protein
MFAASGLYSAFLAIGSPEYIARTRRVQAAERVLKRAATPEGLARLRDDPAFADAIGRDPSFGERLSDAVAGERAVLRDALPGLNPAEQRVLDRAGRTDASLEDDVRHALDFSQNAGDAAPPAVPRRWARLCLAILAWPVLWAAGAFLFRGGLSNPLTGVLLVRAAGDRPRRRLCAARALLVWLPVALLLCASVMVRAHAPEAITAYRSLWWAAIVLLPGYLVAALIDPERGPHDRLLGTWLVPR